MSTPSSDLLRRLAPGVGPGAAVGPVSRAPSRAEQARQLGGATFADLLGKAAGGSLESGLPVSVDDGAGVNLTPEQLSRVAKAADRAETEGFVTALVHIDGQQVLLDVQARRITGRVDASNPVAKNIDGVVMAPPAEGAGGPADVADAAQSVLNLPRKSLLKLLDRPQARPPGPSEAAPGASAA